MIKYLFLAGGFIATWGAFGCALYFTHAVGDMGAAIATASGCMLAGGLIMSEVAQ